MKRFLISLAFLTIGTANAADLAYKAPTYTSTMYGWSGPYLGAQAGMNWSNVSIPAGPASVDTGQFQGGILAGWNWQLPNNWLVGLEADVSAATQAQLKLAGFSVGFQEQVSGTIRGRVGYIIAANTLLYATGGAAWMDGKATVTGIGATLQPTAMHYGWVAGAGIETVMYQNWRLRGEYLHIDYTAKNYSFGGFPVSIKPTDDVVRVGLIFGL